MPVTTAEPSVRFASSSEMIDALMLFGAGMSTSAAGSDRVNLAVARTRRQWPALAWAVILLELHDHRMHLGSSTRSIRNKLLYKTHAVRLLRGDYDRWYPPGGGGAVAPADIALTDGVLAAWLVDALGAAEPDRPIKLDAPRLGTVAAASLARQIRDRGWAVEVIPTRRYHALSLPVEQRPLVEAWLEARVPRRVWRPGEPEASPAEARRRA